MGSRLKELKALFPQGLQDRLYLVGGAVRDLVFGADCSDFDLIALLPAETLPALGFYPVNPKSTPNIYFRFVKGLGKIEVTLIPCAEFIPADLQRRDFTINAMLMTLEGIISDPLHGEADLKARRLVPCSPTSLSDDPIRIFRALRFECDGFRLSAEGERAIAQVDWSAPLEAIPIERFSSEMLKALEKETPATFFRRMLELGVGENLLPEIFAMPKVPAGPLKHHPEGDLFTHSLQVLERVAKTTPNLNARFCAFFHDLGKLDTPADLYPKHLGHEEAGRRAADPFCRRLRLPLPLIRGLQGTCRMHLNANRWSELRTATKVRLAVDAVKCGIAGFLPTITKADCGRDMDGWDEVLRVARLNVEELGFPKGHFDREGIPAAKRGALLLERRVRVLRGENRGADGGSGTT